MPPLPTLTRAPMGTTVHALVSFSCLTMLLAVVRGYGGSVFASTFNPTVLVNTEAFQIIDDGDATANMELRFGETLRQKLAYDRTNNRFFLSDDLLVQGHLFATGAVVAGLRNTTPAAKPGVPLEAFGTISGASLTVNGATMFNNVSYTWPAAPAAASGTVVLRNDAATNTLSWGRDPGVYNAPDPIMGKRFGWALPLLTTDTTFNAVGMTAPAIFTAGTVAAAPQTNRMFIKYPTSTTLNNVAGVNGPYTQTIPSFRPVLSTIIKTDPATITSTRIWIALTSASLGAVVANASQALATHFVGVAYDTASNVNAADWLCCSGDGTTATCSDTGIAVTANTEYTVALDWSNANSLSCIMVNAKITKMTNLSTSTSQRIGPLLSITTLTTAARNLLISRYMLEQN